MSNIENLLNYLFSLCVVSFSSIAKSTDVSEYYDISGNPSIYFRVNSSQSLFSKKERVCQEQDNQASLAIFPTNKSLNALYKYFFAEKREYRKLKHTIRNLEKL